MNIVANTEPHTAALRHFREAMRFYEDHGQQRSAIAHLTAGLVALAAQVARIERAVVRD